MSTEKKYHYYTKALQCPDGSRKYIRGKTKEELEAKVLAARMQLGMGVNLNDNTTFFEFTQMWVDVYKRPNITPQSTTIMLSRINTHLIPYLAPMRMRDIKPAHIAQVMSALSGKSRSLQASVLSLLRSIFRCAEENHVIARSPVVSSIKPTGRPPAEREALTEEQCVRLLQAAKRRSGDLYTFVLIGLNTGMRRGEILGLAWDCIDFDADEIHVMRQKVLKPKKDGPGKCLELTDTLKTENADRVLPLTKALKEHLLERKAQQGGRFVLDGYTSREAETLWSALERLGRVSATGKVIHPRAPLDFHCHAHLLRHTYATRLFEQGLDIKDVQYLLGHSAPSLTLRIYTHYTRESRRQRTAEKVEAALQSMALCS